MSSSAVGTACLLGAVLSPKAIAVPQSAVITIDQTAQEDFTDLTRRAEQAARTAAQRYFSNSAGSELSLTVLGQNDGNIVPVLDMTVSRDQWLSQPNPQRWATYYSSAAQLLQPPAPIAPATAVAPLPPPPPVNGAQPANQPTTRVTGTVPVNGQTTSPTATQTGTVDPSGPASTPNNTGTLQTPSIDQTAPQTGTQPGTQDGLANDRATTGNNVNDINPSTSTPFNDPYQSAPLVPPVDTNVNPSTVTPFNDPYQSAPSSIDSNVESPSGSSNFTTPSTDGTSSFDPSPNARP